MLIPSTWLTYSLWGTFIVESTPFHLSLFPGLIVYFGYGIWHSKEGRRELQPKDMAARYVVLPSGSLVETVQPVQPDGQMDNPAHHINAASTSEDYAEKRWCVTKYSRRDNCLVLSDVYHSKSCTITSVLSVSHSL